MSDSVRPHRWQPTRLPSPWDSPGKNTGVGCHFLLQCMKVKSESEVTQSCPTLSDPMDCSLLGSSVHGIFQAKILEWGAIAFSTTSYLSKFQIYDRVLVIVVPMLYITSPERIHLIIDCLYPWVGKISWKREWQPTPVFLPGKFHGLRSLAGYNP